jgi:DNA-directed RNA polymerase subunit RPC12/RpoP
MFRCWRCNRGLLIEEAPKQEHVVIRCPRCKSSNVVQDGHRPVALAMAGLVDSNLTTSKPTR